VPIYVLLDDWYVVLHVALFAVAKYLTQVIMYCTSMLLHFLSALIHIGSVDEYAIATVTFEIVNQVLYFLLFDQLLVQPTHIIFAGNTFLSNTVGTAFLSILFHSPGFLFICVLVYTHVVNPNISILIHIHICLRAHIDINIKT
jgi:hypothetical protein